jgi:ABC-2 type transport system permease protein
MFKKKENTDLKQIGIVMRYELLKHLRRRRLIAVLAITLIVSSLQLAVPPAFNIAYPEEPKSFAESFLSFVHLLVIICGAFFAGDAIASEFEQKTGYILFPNPVKRVVLVAGKFLAAVISVFLMVGLYYAICFLSILTIYGVTLNQLVHSFAYAFLFLLGVLGLTFLFSSLLKGSMGATLLSFFMLFMILPIMEGVLTITGNEPWYSITYSSQIITEVINPSSVRVEKIVVKDSPITVWVFHPDFLTSTVVLLTYFIATLVLTLLIIDRKEMV